MCTRHLTEVSGSPYLPGAPFIQKMSYLFTIEPGSRWKRIKNYVQITCVSACYIRSEM